MCEACERSSGLTAGGERGVMGAAVWARWGVRLPGRSGAEGALAAPLSYGTMGASRGSGGRDNMVKLVPKPYNPSNVHSGCAEPQKKAQIFSPTISIMCKTQNFVSV